MNLRPKHNVFKSDVFSLGVCMMNAALLESCDDIYNFTKFTVNEMTLEEKLEKMKLQFPPELVSVVAQMVALDEKNRLDFILLEKAFEDQKRAFLERNSSQRPMEDPPNSNKLVLPFPFVL